MFLLESASAVLLLFGFAVDGPAVCQPRRREERAGSLAGRR